VRNRDVAAACKLLVSAGMKTLVASELAAVAGGFTKAQVATRMQYFASSDKELGGQVDVGTGTRTPMSSGGYEYRFPVRGNDTTAPGFYRGTGIAKCPDSKISHCALSLSPSLDNLK
jgi:hypothetical protein